MVAASFFYALTSVNWSVKDLFITPDQQGRLLMAKKDFREAAKVFQNPMQRGTALYRNGDFKEAAAAFGQDDSVEAVYNRANALLMQGKYDDAISGYQQALSIKPDWPEAQGNLALARARKEKMKPPEDDAGGTGGMLEADEIVFDKRAAKAPDDQQEQVTGGEQLSDQEMRAMWLRRVQTKPADFLRAKFSYQRAVRQEAGAGKQEIEKN
ncbi:MAG: tetratricopeptide repeat protein [Deltaproteobacteria bacterium]|nr:tetratricopeptide repeat protein [Deltaproteobacteria bacterium]